MANLDARQLTGVDYQYDLYNNYLDQLDDILLKYGQKTGLAIQYWHIRVDLSLNYDDLRMQNSYKHYVYDILHFVPTIDMTPVTYQIGYQQDQQGTSNVGTGTFSMYLIDKPLPGDLFKFYVGGDLDDPKTHVSDTTEIFRITDVRYVRSAKNKLQLYQLDFETAPIHVDTMEHIRINQILCWENERAMFINEEQCNSMGEIVDNRDKLIDEINKYYDEINGWYGKCADPGTGGGFCFSEETKTRPLVFLNTILRRLKKYFPAIKIKPIFGIGTAKIPIAWIDPPNGDYWDTFTCLSFNPEANAGEVFNVTQILAGNCHRCPEELVKEIECHRRLLELTYELAMLLKPLITDEQWNERDCFRNCCDATDVNYLIACAANNSLDSEDFFWDFEGPDAGSNAQDFCEQYENATCVPLYITWRDGAHWPDGGITAQ